MEKIINLLDLTTVIIGIGTAAILIGVCIWLFRDPNLWTSLVAALIIASFFVWLFLTYDGALLVLHERGTTKHQEMVKKKR